MTAIVDLFPECRDGRIRLRFDSFLERVLYHPRYGYYCRPELRFDKQGDFYTSSHVHFFFAEILAEQFLQIWEDMGRPDPFGLLEIGPGDGMLAWQLLGCIQRRFTEFYRTLRYLGLELSASLAKQQSRKLAAFPQARILCAKYASVDVAPFEGSIFSNEFFDALPFRRLRRERGRWVEYFVDIQPERIVGRWESTDWKPKGRCTVPLGTYLEWREQFESFYQFASKVLKRGTMFHFDYGDLRENPSRRGTLRTFYRHHLGEDPFAHLGEQDITANVDFSHLMALASRHGFRSRLLSQRQYLIERGILEKAVLRFERMAPERPEVIEEKLTLKDLIVPGGISDCFMVLIQEKIGT
ncbi:MAG: SAM-dependent methyltransferase [Acidobacteria bacterium]|nr:SAM-dependent methyltransferase [Acidobacteriota bacterium]